MTVKTLTASTISAALAEARRQFGEDVVLLESAPPVNGNPARITIMADAPQSLVETAPQRSLTPAARTEKRQLVTAASYGYAGSSLDFTVEDDSVMTDENAASRLRVSGRPRGSLFPSAQNAVAAAAPSSDKLETLLNERLEVLYDRLSGIEKRFDGFPAAAAQYQRHPLFQRLIDRGLSPDTVTELFSRCGEVNREDEQAIFWALAKEIRTLLTPCAPVRMSGAQILIGFAGSGKTSLALRLSRDNGFFGRRKTGVIVIAADDDLDTIGADPVAVYHRHGIPVQSVGNAAEMDAALRRLSGFDHVVVDTPALPRDLRGLKEAAARLRPILAEVVPSQVLMVVDATTALDETDLTCFRHLAVSPDALCLTKMDEASRPGRIAEWLRKTGRPVNVLASGRSASNGLSMFSPAGFAEQLLSR